MLHETIRMQGDHELERSVAALWWSALAAGLTMGLSLMAMGLLNSRLEGIPGSHVISSLGYSAGFLAVIWRVSNCSRKTPSQLCCRS